LRIHPIFRDVLLVISIIHFWLPILVSSIFVFFASFLSWMVLQLHRNDWRRLPREDEFMDTVRDFGLAEGNYMFPTTADPQEMKSAAFTEKLNRGPCGVITIMPRVNMGRNLGLTFLYYLFVSFCLAYLATLGLASGDDFLKVFRFVSTAGLMTYLFAMVPHGIWFRCRIVGHIVESIGFAIIVGIIFGLMWPR
jgi:hypothetical protein